MDNKKRIDEAVRKELHSRGWNPDRDQNDPRFVAALRQAESRALSRLEEEDNASAVQAERRAAEEKRQQSDAAKRIEDQSKKLELENQRRAKFGLPQLEIPKAPASEDVPNPDNKRLLSAPEAKSEAVKGYIQKKYGIGNASPKPESKPESPAPSVPAEMKPGPMDEFSDEKFKAAQQRSQEKQSDLAPWQFLAGLGGAISGRGTEGSNQNFNQLRNKIQEEEVGSFEKRKKAAMENLAVDRDMKRFGREDAQFDPASPQSVAFRKIIESNFPQIAKSYGDKWNNVSAADKELIFEPIKLKETIESRRATQALSMAEKSGKRTENDKKMGTFVTEGIRSVRGMRDALANGDNTFSLVGDNDYTRNLLVMAENYGRMQSGGAINKDEEKRFIAMAPRVTDSKEQQRKKLDHLERMFQERAQVYGVDLSNMGSMPSSGGKKPSWAK